MKKCYICGDEMVYKKGIVRNYKWGSEIESYIEEVMAHTCTNCGEMVFEPSEVKRLQELSKNY